MSIKVFDTHVRTKTGHYLHFDVLIEGNDTDKAKAHAREYLLEKGLNDEDIAQSECRFCHVEPGNPEVAQAISRQGYYILELQGCKEV
ncbi:DUF2024 family protein [Pseudomonas mandelii]|uniref:DUF2024 family protein n=1 Tax=Pseudomonas mandelii TaxID=75612 RepID=UPI00224ABDFD|nr:DUF2024 family protein [Pseudomonas mandelii]MCX2898125.1 DUF2024 family protein [Pseudomonas mandelii]